MAFQYSVASEETLTLHRRGLFVTTNCIENPMEEVQGHIDDVKRWPHSPQRHRGALPLMESESSYRRWIGYQTLPDLADALKEAIPDRE